MDVDQFRKYGKEMIDYICDYAVNIERYNVAPIKEPGFLRLELPNEAPVKGEDFDKVLVDFEEKIMAGVLHWNHPRFFAYFPSGNSFPSILGDLLGSAIGAIGFSWASCPALTELETIIMDWYGKALGLPKDFLSDTPGSRGGGAIQSSASECTLVCMITARARAINMLIGCDVVDPKEYLPNLNTNKNSKPKNVHDSIFLPQLIAYTSKEAHSSVEKAAKMALVKLRLIETDSRGRMRVDLLEQTIQNDINAGLTPFFVVATVGTTGTCAFDNILKIGKVCEKVPSIWFHVDGAYAGNAFILPEMRKYSEGLEYADSFNTNPNKLLLTNFDASAMWVRDVMCLKTALNVDPVYLQHEQTTAIDYRHYGIALSRRFRALKLWFVFRSYGISGIQAYIRNHITLAKKFEALVLEDKRFIVENDVYLGLVCFRMRTDDRYNQELLAQINHTGKMHMIPSVINGKYIIRFCVTYEHATEEHIKVAWDVIKYYAEAILAEVGQTTPPSPSSVAEGKQIHAKPPIKKKLNRTTSLRFSFTRSVSRDMYENLPERLRDGCTPILVIDSNALTESFQKALANNNNMKAIADDDTDEASN